MYRYSPPKSNTWGHSLKNMKPDKQRTLFAEFLKRAVAEYTWEKGSLTFFAGEAPPFLQGKGPWGHVTDKDIHRFEHLLGAGAKNGSFPELSPLHGEAALNEIIRDGALLPAILLLQHVVISKWRVEGQAIATQSRIMLYYGMKPCISTFLEFQSVEQFQFVKKTLSDLHFCTLNEKHLKPVKRGKR
jgi:hypothetical protein